MAFSTLEPHDPVVVAVERNAFGHPRKRHLVPDGLTT